jgi:hypothetical protein
LDWMTIVKAFLGGVMGLILGTLVGCIAVTQIYLHRFPPPPDGGAIGWSVRFFLHSVVFWLIVLACTLGLAVLATRIGHWTT